MVKRKSPYEHQVGSHVRDGRPVRDYQRGKGDRTIKVRKSRVVGNTNTIESYNILIFYADEPREEFPVEAKNYGDALNASIEMRDKPQPPKIIRMRMAR